MECDYVKIRTIPLRMILRNLTQNIIYMFLEFSIRYSCINSLSYFKNRSKLAVSLKFKILLYDKKNFFIEKWLLLNQ